jgi:hypothetical protein
MKRSSRPAGRDVTTVTDRSGDPTSENTLVEQIELVAGETIQWGPSLDAGPTIAILAQLPPDIAYSEILYVKLVGGRAPTTLTDLEARLAKPEEATFLQTTDTAGVMEFRDVQRGRTTFCVRVRDAAHTPVGFGCAGLDVRSSPDVQEVTIAVRPVAVD